MWHGKKSSNQKRTRPWSRWSWAWRFWKRQTWAQLQCSERRRLNVKQKIETPPPIDQPNRPPNFCILTCCNFPPFKKSEDNVKTPLIKPKSEHCLLWVASMWFMFWTDVPCQVRNESREKTNDLRISRDVHMEVRPKKVAHLVDLLAFFNTGLELVKELRVHRCRSPRLAYCTIIILFDFIWWS